MDIARIRGQRWGRLHGKWWRRWKLVEATYGYVLLRGYTPRMRIIIVVSFTGYWHGIVCYRGDKNMDKRDTPRYTDTRCHSPVNKCKLSNTFSYLANLFACSLLLINWWELGGIN